MATSCRQNNFTEAAVANSNNIVADDSITPIERHTHDSGYIRDAIIGLADGLTVPFALTAGLSSYAHPSLANLHLLL